MASVYIFELFLIENRIKWKEHISRVIEKEKIRMGLEKEWNLKMEEAFWLEEEQRVEKN